MPTVHYIEHTRTVWPGASLGDTAESKVVYDLPNDTGVQLGLVDLIISDRVDHATYAVAHIDWEHGEDYVSVYGRKLRKDGKGFRTHYNEYCGRIELSSLFGCGVV